MATDLDMGLDGHTPGPWVADFHNEQREGGRFITYVRGGNQLVPIAAVPTGVEGYGREEGRANASVIAAAPDMLTTLEGLSSSMSAILESDLRRAGPAALIPAWLAEIRAAIAKAKAPSRA